MSHCEGGRAQSEGGREHTLKWSKWSLKSLNSEILGPDPLGSLGLHLHVARGNRDTVKSNAAGSASKPSRLDANLAERDGHDLQWMYSLSGLSGVQKD